jgi:hypothetical protein
VKTIWEYIKENFEDEMLQILSLAAFVALIVGVINEGWKEVHNFSMIYIRDGLMGWPFS